MEYLEESSDTPLKRKSPYILKRQAGRSNKSRRPYILKRSMIYWQGSDHVSALNTQCVPIPSSSYSCCFFSPDVVFLHADPSPCVQYWGLPVLCSSQLKVPKINLLSNTCISEKLYLFTQPFRCTLNLFCSRIWLKDSWYRTSDSDDFFQNCFHQITATIDPTYNELLPHKSASKPLWGVFF